MYDRVRVNLHIAFWPLIHVAMHCGTCFSDLGSGLDYMLINNVNLLLDRETFAQLTQYIPLLWILSETLSYTFLFKFQSRRSKICLIYDSGI
ncbi:hypothetical protein V1506DRAFT_525599, partial [Lipomyces tetrasporus]